MAKRKAKRILNDEELERFMAECRKDAIWHDFFYVELTTGLRRGELLALQWSDLNFDTGELRITKQICRINGKLVISEPKTKASIRTLLLPPVILDMLKAHKASTHSRRMFPSPKIAHPPHRPARRRGGPSHSGRDPGAVRLNSKGALQKNAPFGFMRRSVQQRYFIG